MSATAPGTALRLGFAGTPEFAARVLRHLLDSELRPVVVYTQPDRPVGRSRKPRPSPVKQLAEAEGLALEQPARLRGEAAAATLANYRLDVLVVAAYGLILPPTILEAPRLGCVNVHASLLPRWRGAAPVERAIMAGDAETGVSIMAMEQGLDTGPVYLRRAWPIHDDTDGPTLEAALAALGGTALVECLRAGLQPPPEPQPDAGATYADKLTRADSQVDWSRPAVVIARQVRALCERQPAFVEVDGVKVAILAARPQAEPGNAAPGDALPGTSSPGSSLPGTILAAGRPGIEVACGSGSLVIDQVRLSIGKGQPMSAAGVASGFPKLLAVGRRLAADTPP